jgi:hypothetical protein
MAANPFNFKLEKDMPLKDMVKGLERLMPVGARNFSLMETTGKNDADGNPEVKVTDLSAIQGGPSHSPRRKHPRPLAAGGPDLPRPLARNRPTHRSRPGRRGAQGGPELELGQGLL